MKHTHSLRCALCAATLAAGIFCFGQNSESGKPPYLNPALPISVRVDDLVGRMTLDEKISQTLNSAPAIERLGIPA